MTLFSQNIQASPPGHKDEAQTSPQASKIEPEVANSPLLKLGLAQINNGRLAITKAGFNALARLQSEASKKQPTKKESGIAKNVAWRGDLILALAASVERSVTLGINPTSHDALRAAHQALRSSGFRITIPKVSAALQIFRGVSEPGEVYERVAAHRSYGDWWKDLSEEARASIADKRREALRRFWNTPELAEVRRQAAASALLERIDELEKSGNDRLSDKFRRADSLSRALRSIDRGNLSGETLSYEGVPERMRSSWEALYARICRSLPQNRRRYVYEPMGFPLIDPASGKIEVYHPDFFELIDRGPGNLSTRVVEIKGELTETGRRKIALFQKYYIAGDFSGLSPEREKLAQALAARAVESAWNQFRVEIGPGTRFCIFGNLPWSRPDNNFVQSRYAWGERCGAAIAGLIPRLQSRWAALVPKAQFEPSRNQRAKAYLEKSSGAERHQPVKPIDGHARIGRAKAIAIDNTSQLRLLVIAKVFETAMLELRAEGVLGFDANFNPRLFTAPALREISQWHVWTPIERGEARKDFGALGAWSASLVAAFAIFSSQLLTKHPALRTIGGKEGDKLTEVLSSNATQIAKSLVPTLEILVRRESTRDPTLEFQIGKISELLGERCADLLNHFDAAVSAGRLKVDLEFMKAQIDEIIRLHRAQEHLWWGVRSHPSDPGVPLPPGITEREGSAGPSKQGA